MNRILPLTSPIFVGIFELDSAGTVLYSRQSQTCPLVEKTKTIIGQNFFENVANFENVPDFRRRFKNFFYSGHSTENFLFECRSNNESYPVKVLMLRASEKNDNQSNEIVILDIRKNES
jgi:hypothetical protein